MQNFFLSKGRALRFICAGLVLLPVLNACTLSKMVKTGVANQKITVTPQVLEVSGNDVTFEIKAQIPAKLVGKKPTYSLNLLYFYGQKYSDPVGKLNFIPGEFVYENNLPTITRQITFPFSPQKPRGTLLAYAQASRKKGRAARSRNFPLATGIITTSKMVVKTNEVTPTPDDYRKGVSEPQTLTFFFDEGQSGLRDYLGTNVSVLQELIESNYKTTKVEIIASHSPEDGDFKDPGLARDRAEMLEKHIKHQIDVNSYVNSNKNIEYTVKTEVRNWEKFLKQVQLSALSADQIAEILDIVNSDDPYKEKTEQLKKLNSYEYLQLYIYPVLRYADVRITYEIPQKLDSEIYLLSKKIVENQETADKLTEEELRYSATLTPLLSEKRKIYQAAAENTLKWQAFNNLGVTYIQMAQKELNPKVKDKLLNEAIVNLTYAAHRNPSARLFYNLASAHHLKGNNTEALYNYDYAIKHGGPVPLLQQVFADKAALEIETGNLDDAIVSLSYAGPGYQNVMNKGLIYLLKGNYEGAQGYYEQALMLKPNDAQAYYNLAVVAARAKQENQLATNLRSATRLEPKFTAKAIDDPEFRSYLTSPVFRDALK